VATAELGTRGIVTPEAVLLEFEPARLGTRTLQMGLDFVIQMFALLVLLVALGAIAGFSGSAGAATFILATVAIFAIVLGYPVACESLLAGRTVGMMAAGLRVVTVEGAPIRFRHAAIRGALLLVDFWILFGAIGAIVMLFNRDSQRLGDLAAGTLVLRERTAAKTDSAITFMPPAGWEPYAASLDPGRMTEEQYGLVRSFLLRVHELSPAARHDLAYRMAGPLALAMNHTPPSSVHPEPFLICAAAAYQRLHAGGDPAWGPDGPLGAYAPLGTGGGWAEPVTRWDGPSEDVPLPPPEAKPF